MIFSEILNVMLNLSNTSIQEFANAILYDRSYVSKWVNDRALPAISGWQETKANMTEFLAAKLSDYDMEHLAIQYPYVQTIVQSNIKQSKKELIETLLEKTYTRTFNRDEILKQEKVILAQDKTKCSAITITDTKNVINYLINFLTQNVYELSEYSTFYYSGNIVRCFSAELLDNYYINYMSPHCLRVKFTVNLDLIINDEQEKLIFVNSFFRIITGLPFLNLEIYEATRKTAHIVRMAQKGNMAGWGFDLKNEVPEVLFVIENEENVNESYLSLQTLFENKNPIFSLQENFEEAFKNIDEDLPENMPIFYTPRLYLYYGSDELKEQMLQDRFINIQEYELWNKLQTFLSRPQIRQAKIIITKSSFNDTFARGWIYKTNGGIQIFGDYYKKYMADIYMMFQRNNIIILDDDKISNVHRLPMSIVYGDQSHSFALRFNQMIPYETRNIMYVSKNKVYTKLVYDWLKAIINIENENFLK
ncbi:MAG: hypothetical protein GX328_06650 [Clostridiaceae bacterium]|nr:hypothetical protein [Clostridiaceae bacterium]